MAGRVGTLTVLQGTVLACHLQISGLLKSLRVLQDSSRAGCFVGADLKMLVRVLEADEKVEQAHGARFFNPADGVPVRG